MSAHLPECLNERARRIDGFFCCCDVLERHKRRLAADYERDVAAAEERGFNDGIGEGWNAALEALPHDRACIVNGRAGAKCNCVRGRAITSLRKDTGREVEG